MDSDGEDLRVGAATSGFDALGRHWYWASAGWSSHNRPFAQVDYVYSRWRPSLFVTASADSDGWQQGEIRSRELGAGVLLPVRRARWTTAFLGALQASQEHVECPACETPVDALRRRRALRLGWNISNVKRFGYSVGPEQGAYAAVTSELTRRALGADGDAGALTADVRGYVRAFPRHAVLAMRVAGASAWGDESVRRVFAAGGPGPRSTGFGFNSDAVGLLRGFDDGDVAGHHVVVANIDYRAPLLQVQRGAGTLPVFLRQVHGAIFADAGTAWDTRARDSDLRRSLGAEIAADIVLGGSFPVTLAAGAAWRDDPTSPNRRGWVTFGRLGYGF